MAIGSDANIVARLKLAGEGFSQDVNRELNQAGIQAETVATRVGGRIKGMLAGLGTAAAVTGIVQLTTAILNHAEALDAAADQAGVNVERWQTLQEGMRRLDVENERFAQGMDRIASAIADVQSGAGGPAVEALQRMGIAQRILNGEIESGDEALDAMAAAQSRYTTQGQWTSDMIDILSRRIGIDFANALEDGGAALHANEEQIRQFGRVLGEEYVERLADAQEATEQFKNNSLADLAIFASDAIDHITDVIAVWRALRAELDDQYSGPLHVGLMGYLNPVMLAADVGRAGSNVRWDATARGATDFLASFNPFETGTPTDGRSRVRAPITPNRSTGGRTPSAPRTPRETTPRISDEARAAEQYRETLAEIIADQQRQLAIGELIAAGHGEQAEQQERTNALLDRIPDLLGPATAEMEQQRALAIAQNEALAEQARLLGETERAKAATYEKEEAVREGEREFIEEQGARRMEIERDLADFYRDAFAGGTGSIWEQFEEMGLEAISNLAAQWTLQLLSGQPLSMGTGGQTGGIGGLLQTLLGGGGKGAANDNPLGVLTGSAGMFDADAFYAASRGGGAGAGPGLAGFGKYVMGGDWSPITVSGSAPGAAMPGVGGGLNPLSGMMLGAGLSELTDMLGAPQSGTGSALGGAAGSLIGSMTPLGPLGGFIGGIVGSLAGGLIGGLLQSADKGSANVSLSGGGLGLGGVTGDAAQAGNASSAANSAIDLINRIVEALDAEIVGSPSVSFGQYKDDLRLDRSGSGNIKGGQSFGQDMEALVRAGVADMLADGVIGGISDAALRVLQSGQDLEEAIDKAMLIESIPRALRERLDPLGAALDEIDEKFRDVAEAMNEGAASAEQIAEARKLWQLEREDAIAQIGEASQSLQDFLESLRVGSGSPLSYREQLTTANAELAPFIAQILAAQASGGNLEGFDQAGFIEAGQAVLALEREIGGSTAEFFDRFNYIQSLTEKAIELVDNAVPIRSTPVDPFTEATANAVKDGNLLLVDQNNLLRQQNALLERMAGGGGGSDFIGRSLRGFASH